jgi:autotransporter-associated beta strand protein
MKHQSAISCCVLIAVLLLLGGTASAATRIWDGSNSNNWNTAANWVGNVVPGTGDDVILTGLGTYRPTNQNIGGPGGISLDSLTFNSSTTTAFTVSGNSITLTSTGTALTVASGAAGHIIACNLILGAATQAWEQDSTKAIAVPGVISDNGYGYGITKTGTGTLIFNGTDTYTGTTTISAGTLQLGDGTVTGNIIPATNLITDNAALIYDSPSTIRYSGVISGTGTFAVTGTGTIRLTGTNTYTGVTNVTAGTLQLGNGRTTGNIIPLANLITDNAALIYDTPSTITQSGVISGSGTFTKSGTGTLTLNGTNTYTGVTTISTGTLQLGDGTVTGNIIPQANLITDNAALIYDTPSTITQSGVISRTGTFTKTGTGTLILSGANTYTGATTVSAGELQFNGVNTGISAKTVSGGTLSGTGTIPGPVTIANSAGSTLRGGTGSGTSGTLTVNGALTFSGTSSSLNVTSNGASLSNVSAGTNGITENSGMTVNLLDTMPAGTYTLISSSAALPGTAPTLGTNNTGKIATFAWTSGTGLTVTLTSPPPTFVSATTNTAGTAINITFNKAMASPAGDQSQFTYSINGGAAQPFSAAALDSNTSLIDLTTSGTAIAYGNTITINYTAGTVKSADGGVLASFNNKAVTNAMPSPPTFASATTNTAGTSINISFNKAMASPTGDQSQFTYSINGSAAQPFSAAALDSNTSIIDLTTSGTAIAYGNTITVNYTAGTVKSADGGVLASFNNKAVTNAMPGTYVSISLNENTINMALIPGSTATNSSLGITVSANARFAVTVADNTGRPAGEQGYMGNYTTSYAQGSNALNTTLASPIGLVGTTNGTTSMGTIAPPILVSGQPLYTGSAAVTNQLLAPNTLTQPVAYADPVMPSGSTYRIDLVYTITLT